MFFLLFLCSCGNSTQKETTKIEPAPTNVAPKLSYTLTNVTHQKEVDGSYHCLKVGILIEKSFQAGHDYIVNKGYDLYSLANIVSFDNGEIKFSE